MKKIIRVLIGLTLLGGLVAFAPGAKADDPPTPEPPSGDPVAECVVSGTVTVDPVLPTMSVYDGGTYTFNSTILECVGLPPYNGTYVVEASGQTTGPLQLDPHEQVLEEGSTTALSWSKGPGSITANNGIVNGSGYVEFLRTASNTVAWGTFTGGTHPGTNFQAQLQFTPQADSSTTGVYDLNGVSTIFAP